MTRVRFNLGWVLGLAACGTTANGGGGTAVNDAVADVAADVADTAVDIAHDTTPADSEPTDSATDAAAPDVAPDNGQPDIGKPDSGPKLTCGDGLCTTPETTASCPNDCLKPVCGDGFCQKPESGVSCALDCAPKALAELACMKKLCPSAVATCTADLACAGVLGNALACASNANGDADQLDFCAQNLTSNVKSKSLAATACGFLTCAGTTTAALCGDGLCQSTESSASCPYDCLGVAAKCGDGICTGEETPASCPKDCATAATCGNSTCEPGEDFGNCPADCAYVAVCGDGVCDTGESASSCAFDCDAAMKAKGDCLKTSCPGEWDACVPVDSCRSAITTALQCGAACGPLDFGCLLGCKGQISGNVEANALSTCGSTNCP